MGSFTRSFMKRIARGGVLAAGIAFLTGSCAVIGDASTEEEGTGDRAVPALGGHDTVMMCHYNGSGSFTDVMVDGDSVADRLAAGDLIGKCAQAFCGDS